MPLRVNDDVVYYFSYASVIEALYYAADHDAHVVSMSLGGPLPSRPLEEALRYALSRGVIAVAAAGNVYPWVVYPGKYDECVCVAAVNCSGGIWRWSARGSAVDVSAPGESVWVACLRDGVFAIERSSGTSYATATTAGAAALWLSYHGRDSLVDKYGRENLASVFKEVLLSRGVTRPAGWKTDEVGAGLLSVAKLLDAPLPKLARAAGIRRLTARGRGVRRESFDEIADFLPGVDRGLVRQGVLGLFDAEESDLPDILDRYGSELAYHLALDPAARRAVIGAGGTSTARASRARRRTASRKWAAGSAFKRDGSTELRDVLR